MQTFWNWLLAERRHELVPQEVLDGYEHGFRRALEQLMNKVQDPVLRDKFGQMLDCPIKDAKGRCRSFTDYIVAALVRHGIHKEADVEEVLSYVYQTMMHDKKISGEPKATVFGSFDAGRAYSPQGNPLEARFKTAIGNAIRNIAAGRIPRLFNTERRQQGSISIGQGRGDQVGSISPDAISSRSDSEMDLGELVGDIRMLLRRKEAAYGLPLVDLFNSMMTGKSQAEQREEFGDRAAKVGRQVIVQTIKDYAESTGNHYLLQLLRRLEEPAERNDLKAPKEKRPVSPAWSSPKEKDYASIMQVVDKLGRPAGTADLGRHRRRWLQFPPRDVSSGHSNRMGEVLSQMVRDGALKTVQTGRGAQAYVPGPNAGRYRQAVGG